MNHIFVRSDFADRHEFRLLSMDDEWLKRFREHPCAAARAAQERLRSSRHKRARAAVGTSTDPEEDASVVLIMKGENQLCLHDETTTRSVRRVEYSNVMMLAQRRLNATGARALQETAAESKNVTTVPPEEPLPRARVPECNDDVVVASLSRMFDSHTAHPQRNILTVLADSYVAIDELEEGAETENGETSRAAPSSSSSGGASAGYTFTELTRRFHSSPAELAQLLQDIGAVVHRGRVRLLHPSLVFEALGAVLTYFDAADPAGMSWQAVRLHLCPAVYPDVVLRSLEAVYGASPAAADEEDVSLAGMAGVLNIPRVLTGLAAGIFDTAADVTPRTLRTGEVARGLPLEVFLDKWWNSIPSSLFGTAGVPSRNAPKAAELFVAQLRGCAVVEPRAGAGSVSLGNGTALQGTLWWMPKEVLTNDFAARLCALFELRPQKWNQEDLQAYMEVLLAPSQNFQHIMVRYAREYRIPGQAVQYAPLT
ncbi:hypothetical protein ABB37_00009 [Leptomonas pyrrhocoris]|uniref:Sister chromatid cohesion protein DCC1 n=1 Tax=Leptomonas pyrrhocoris TaxID=157538 RepID=A0A0M9G9S5_LEPPY|nr:hypothetical protein ABB37_00009 [Leptomonas pyrrhocoris]KPA85599.1 hypothetical protein ABB37_00009 [Leptomonas pyrrhocoris]|eukprot:XP_015664038.1 hypothetical protein ABB37_00009 [Leptomonas pyrrhocoris]